MGYGKLLKYYQRGFDNAQLKKYKKVMNDVLLNCMKEHELPTRERFDRNVKRAYKYIKKVNKLPKRMTRESHVKFNDIIQSKIEYLEDMSILEFLDKEFSNNEIKNKKEAKAKTRKNALPRCKTRKNNTVCVRNIPKYKSHNLRNNKTWSH
jgi:hypothetical protein